MSSNIVIVSKELFEQINSKYSPVNYIAMKILTGEEVGEESKGPIYEELRQMNRETLEELFEKIAHPCPDGESCLAWPNATHTFARHVDYCDGKRCGVAYPHKRNDHPEVGQPTKVEYSMTSHYPKPQFCTQEHNDNHLKMLMRACLETGILSNIGSFRK